MASSQAYSACVAGPWCTCWEIDWASEQRWQGPCLVPDISDHPLSKPRRPAQSLYSKPTLLPLFIFCSWVPTQGSFEMLISTKRSRWNSPSPSAPPPNLMRINFIRFFPQGSSTLRQWGLYSMEEKERELFKLGRWGALGPTCDAQRWVVCFPGVLIARLRSQPCRSVSMISLDMHSGMGSGVTLPAPSPNPSLEERWQ